MRRGREAAWLLAIAAACFAAGKLGLRLAFVHPSATAIWPASGIALAALLLRGPRAWPAVFVSAFLVNQTTAGSALSSLGIAAGNTLLLLQGHTVVTGLMVLALAGAVAEQGHLHRLIHDRDTQALSEAQAVAHIGSWT